jgi:hypothetical protein
MAADWVTVATAAASGLIGLGGSWFFLGHQRRADEAKWQRQVADQRQERQQQLYLDMMTHVIRTENWLGLLLDDIAWIDVRRGGTVNRLRRRTVSVGLP